MASLNKVMLMGNLTRDPEIRYSQSGVAVTTFTIAVNHVYKAQNGERKEEVDFIRITVFGKLGENCAKYLNKGKPVFVEGRLKYSTWEAQDGKKMNKLDVIGSNIHFLGKSDAGTSGEGMESDSSKGNVPDVKESDIPSSTNEDDIPF